MADIVSTEKGMAIKLCQDEKIILQKALTTIYEITGQIEDMDIYLNKKNIFDLLLGNFRNNNRRLTPTIYIEQEMKGSK